ncbi:WXG100 family type VII secretion target [Nocardia sp. NPDC049220]|uniref:WXG100 family type VII secretion target n=1 Tax=Nocardia sp. NPDC049220 TaxID=3155273 RepID=UPI0033C19018
MAKTTQVDSPALIKAKTDMEQVVEDIAGTAKRLLETVETGHQWAGKGAEAFKAMHRELNGEIKTLNDRLRDVSDALHSSDRTFQTQEDETEAAIRDLSNSMTNLRSK